jgi:dihydroxyacetone kinase DhaKLM complex PTS-EIIA-like component DhaM
MEAPISVVDVSTSADDGNVGSNTIDGNLTTRWSAKGDGQWIQYDLGSSHTLNQLAIAFYQGNQRSAEFEILISEDAITWDNILKATSSGTTLTQESYQIKGTPARYVRLVGYGNSINSWNSITEVDILGIDQQYASN